MNQILSIEIIDAAALRFLRDLAATKLIRFKSESFNGQCSDIPARQKKTPKIGGWEGKIHIPDDFNAPLDDFKEYM